MRAQVTCGSARDVKARERRVWASYRRRKWVALVGVVALLGASGGWRLCDTAIKCDGCYSCPVE